MLASLRTLSSNSDSVFVPTIEKALTLRGSHLTDLIASQVHDRLRDRQEVQNLLAQPPSNIGQKRSFSQAEIMSSIEDGRKRVKYYEEQTEKVKKMVANGF